MHLPSRNAELEISYEDNAGIPGVFQFQYGQVGTDEFLRSGTIMGTLDATRLGEGNPLQDTEIKAMGAAAACLPHVATIDGQDRLAKLTVDLASVGGTSAGKRANSSYRGFKQGPSRGGASRKSSRQGPGCPRDPGSGADRLE